MKFCKKCNEEKDEEFFGKNSKSKDGLSYSCKKCEVKRIREVQNKNPEKYEYSHNTTIKRHGLTIDQYNNLYNKYSGKCWICKVEKCEVIDHNHNCCKSAYSCGTCVRGLLCQKCNQAIGLLGENKDTIFSILEYLK